MTSIASNMTSTASIIESLKFTMSERTRLRSELADKIKRTKLTSEQFLVLCEIPPEGINAGELATASVILRPSLSRMIKKLRALNIISAVQSDKDKREQVIKLTRKGKNLLARVQ